MSRGRVKAHPRRTKGGQVAQVREHARRGKPRTKVVYREVSGKGGLAYGIKGRLKKPPQKVKEILYKRLKAVTSKRYDSINDRERRGILSNDRAGVLLDKLDTMFKNLEKQIDHMVEDGFDPEPWREYKIKISDLYVGEKHVSEEDE